MLSEQQQSQVVPNNHATERSSGRPMMYQIRVRSHIGSDWADRFDGLTITLEEDGNTLLSGPVVDQAALHGLLKKVRDLGMILVSVNPVPCCQSQLEKRKVMKAILFPRYGSPDVLQLKEVEKPTPREDEVLIKVHAASINSYDWRHIRAAPFLVRLGGGLLKPKDPRLGADVAGRIEAIGRNVKQFQPGDAVFGDVSTGGYAEYVCAREKILALKPANISYAEAAAAPMAALTALQGLRDKGQIKPGQKVLINGASGGVGTFAVQIAKYYGAEVTGVCRTRNLDMTRSIGADYVIDYTREDFTKNGRQYDLIFDVAANRSVFAYRRALSPKGKCVVAGFSTMPHLLHIMLLGPRVSKTDGPEIDGMGIASVNRTDLVFISELLEARKVVPVIDGCYPLSEIARAFWYFEKEHARGKVIINVAEA